jgi:hypothetical protein
MAFRRDVLNEMGGFNVALGGGTPTKGAEDSFAFTKCLLERHHLVYQPTAVVRHTHYDTLEGLSRQMRGYGTGLTAYYLALVMSRPSLLLELLRLLPAAINDLRGRDSIRTATMRDFPASVLRAHRVGMIRGMPAYLKSVIEQRRKDRAHRDGD